MRIAVTGASGFIGRHVLSALSGVEAEIVAVTRDPSRIREMPRNGERVVWDIAQVNGCFEALKQPDVLVHLAWDGLPHYKSLHHFEVELPKQYAFLREMVRRGTKHIVVSGTCLEYGMQEGARSESDVTQPSTPYGFAKDSLRKQLSYLQNDTPFALTWGRLFYTFGDGQSAGSLFAQLKAAALRNDPVFKMSKGEQLRDFLPVEQVAEIIARSALHPTGVGVVNICSGQPISVRRFVEQLMTRHLWSMKLEMGHYPYPDYEPLSFWGNADKLEQLSFHIRQTTSEEKARCKTK